jgi:hypothetical protein
LGNILFNRPAWFYALAASVTSLSFFLQQPTPAGDNAIDSVGVIQSRKSSESWKDSIRILSPAVGSDIEGRVSVVFAAPGMIRAEVRCWRQPDADHPGPWGYDAVVMAARQISGKASFEFPADAFPHGPVNLRIGAFGNAGQWDEYELQLYNRGGVEWNQGIPPAPPPAAEGMRLVFADDFRTLPSISPRGDKAVYAAHKPRFGDFSGWRFSHPDDFEGAYDPFEQRDTWLRIKARRWGEDKQERGTGLISSARFDGSGIWTQAPCYFEARLVAHSAPGTWPAFWVTTNMNRGEPGDELDVIEGYGGAGKGTPNSDVYHVASHFWRQFDIDGSKLQGYSRRVPLMELGGMSFWSTTAHTYAVKISREDTIYFFDNLEVLRHPTGKLSASQPFFFMINYAIGGASGWKVDLDRYANASDMWVDYVRVYQGGDKDLSRYISPQHQ